MRNNELSQAQPYLHTVTTRWQFFGQTSPTMPIGPYTLIYCIMSFWALSVLFYLRLIPANNVAHCSALLGPLKYT